MKKKSIWRILAEITLELFYSIGYFIQNNLIHFATLLEAVTPYVMFVLGQHLYKQRMSMELGSEMFIPIGYLLLKYYVIKFADKRNRGQSIPVPLERFTEVTQDGVVSIPNKRVEELLLYVGDLEDWMERKGLL